MQITEFDLSVFVLMLVAALFRSVILSTRRFGIEHRVLSFIWRGRAKGMAKASICKHEKARVEAGRIKIGTVAPRRMCWARSGRTGSPVLLTTNRFKLMMLVGTDLKVQQVE